MFPMVIKEVVALSYRQRRGIDLCGRRQRVGARDAIMGNGQGYD